MPRLAARRHSLRFFLLHIHNQTELERQVLRSPLMCVSLREQRTAYAAAIVRALWDALASVASHSLLIEPIWLFHNYSDIANATAHGGVVSSILPSAG
jgi:hypothetical protein